MKRVATVFVFFVGLLLSSIIILALLIDANMFKPRITALAKDQGIALDMRGNLRWAFWPSIGLAVNDLHIASVSTPTAPIAQIKKASFLVAFAPLMRGEFQVKHVLIDGAIINVTVDEQGQGNWQDLFDAKKIHSPSNQPIKDRDSAVTSNDLHLRIEKLSIHHSVINYIDHIKDQHLALTDINLDLNDVNTESKPFALSLSWAAQLGSTKGNAKPVMMKGKLHNNILLSADFNSVNLQEGNLTLDVNALTEATLAIKFNVKLDDIKNNMQYQGDISLPSLNARQWLAAFGGKLNTANERALSDLGVASKFSGDKKHIALNSLTLRLDKTNINGSAAVTDFAVNAMTLNAQGDDINVDDYLAPPVDANLVATTSTNSADEVLLPIETLRKLNVDMKVSFKSIIFSALKLEKSQLDITAKNGIIQQSLKTNVYEGSVVATSNVDVREAAAQIGFDVNVKNLALAPLLKAKKMDKDFTLSGAIQVTANGKANGVSMNQMMDSLTGTAHFSGAQVRLSPLNIKQQFCKLVDVVNKAEAPEKTWDAFTEMRELEGKVTIAKRIIVIENFNAGVEQLVLTATGKVDLINNGYDFLLPLKVIKKDLEPGADINEQGCKVSNNYWAERGMSLLRCKGSFANINPTKDCRPDKNALSALTKDFAEYKLREKHGAKMEATKEKLMKKLDDKLGGEGGAEKTKDLLKNLFKKRKEPATTNE